MLGLADFAARKLGYVDDYIDLAMWNDAEGRTHAQVIGLLDAYIEHLEARQ